jgi:hypothetical protein
MKTNMFRKILGLEREITPCSVLNDDISSDSKRMIIPREYLIEVITTIPERRIVIEHLDINQE